MAQIPPEGQEKHDLTQDRDADQPAQQEAVHKGFRFLRAGVDRAGNARLDMEGQDHRTKGVDHPRKLADRGAIVGMDQRGMESDKDARGIKRENHRRLHDHPPPRRMGEGAPQARPERLPRLARARRHEPEGHKEGPAALIALHHGLIIGHNPVLMQKSQAACPRRRQQAQHGHALIRCPRHPAVDQQPQKRQHQHDAEPRPDIDGLLDRLAQHRGG